PSSDHWLDVEVFEQQVRRVLARPPGDAGPDEVHTLETVLQLYTGDLLEAFSDEWATLERERLHRLFVEALVHLMLWHRLRGSLESSITYGQRALQHDPLREELHREMMLLYLDTGHRAMAIRQYQVCRGLLAAELDVAPMEETRALYARIAPAQDREPAPPRPSGPAPTTAELLRLLHEISGELDEIGRRVRGVARMAERAWGGPDRDRRVAGTELRPRPDGRHARRGPPR
ncbi:MAG TPA: bacterial transcriptional activator domain-containing protein, partial [Actinomycetes bacterium]